MKRNTIIFLSALLLHGCAAPLVIGGAAATGAAVANDRRTAGTMLDDERIEMSTLNEVARDQKLVDGTHLDVTSYNGIVLLTGEAETKALSQQVVDIARRQLKVRRIINELRIVPLSDASSRRNDAVITTRVKSRLVNDERVDGTAIKVITEQGTVFLMGLVTQKEAAIAVDITRHTEGVQRIIKVFEYQS
jgi:osmotically-inducible protein OsmY